jgi:FG-GAP repeat
MQKGKANAMKTKIFTSTSACGIATFLCIITASQISNSELLPCPPDSVQLSVVQFTGEAADDNMGMGLDAAGDFNGDSIPDLVVGAPYADAGETDGGAAYIFLGGDSSDTNWDFRVLAEAVDDQLGYSVAGVGDLDKDGFDDIAAGARWNDRAGNNKGAVWLVFGSGPPFGLNSIVLTGNTDGEAGFGHAVSGGDFNGDGYADVVVGAPFDMPDFLSYQAGKVQIFYGGDAMDTDADVTIYGEAQNDHFGWSVDCAGDVNNDGYDDLVVGARWYGQYPDSGRGKAYIYYGGDPMDIGADIELTGNNSNDWVGYDVAGAGDINRDGFADVLVGAPYFEGGAAVGRVYLLYGGSAMDNVPDLIFDGSTGGDQFGWSVDGGKDINGDGYDDVVVGARFNDCHANAGGAAYVFYGGDPADTQPDIVVGSSAPDDALGTAVAMLGDWSQAGLPMVAASAVWNDANGSASGTVFAFMPAVVKITGLYFAENGALTRVSYL